MTPFAAALPAPCCQADWQLLNWGAWSKTHLVGTAACAACGAVYSIRADVRLLQGSPIGRRPGRQASEAVDHLAARAREMVVDGHSIAHACRTVGIDRHSYYHRHPTERRTA